MRKFLLSAAALFFGSVAMVMAQTSPFPGHQVAEGDDWYLYNVESGLWLGNNNDKPNDWTTRAQVNAVGLDWGLYSLNGGWRMDAKFNGNGSMNGSNCYLDTPDAVTSWTFTQIDVEGADVAYAISFDGKALGVGDDMHLNCSNTATRNKWVLVTRAERIEWLKANANESNPMEASFLIPSYDLANANKRESSWHIASEGSGNAWNNGGYALGMRNRVKEAWGLRSLDTYVDCTNIPDGKYKVYGVAAYVPTSGGDMNINDYNAYVEQGDATVHGIVYANANEGKMKSAYSLVSNERKNDYFTKDLGSNVWVANGVNEFNHHLCEGHFNSDPIEVLVTDGKMRIGYKLDGTYTGSWIMISGARMEYLGEVVDLTIFIDALNALLEEAEVYYNQLLESEVFTTQMLLMDFAGAYMEAQNAVESNDKDAIIEATNNLRDAMLAAKAVNTTDLVKVLTWLQNNADEWFEAELENGMDLQEGAVFEAFMATYAATSQAEVNNAKNAVINAYKYVVASASPMPEEWTMISESVVGTDDNVPGQNGKYYAYNVGTGRWFCGGDDWGAHAAVGFPGIEFEVISDNWNNGHYNGIITGLFNGNWGNSGKLGNNGYCDTGGNAWKFWQKDASKGIYTWTNNGNDQGVNESNGFGTRDMVGFNANTYMRVDVHQADDNNPNNQWVFVTHEQRLNSLANATAKNPVDATFMIKMPGFNQRERVEGTNQDGDTDETKERLYWECNHENYTYDNEIYVYRNISAHRHIIADRGANHADFAVDIYGAQWNDAFSLKQTIEGLPAGLYCVKVQGYNNGGADENKAVLVANDKSVELADIESVEPMAWLGGWADNTWAAIEYFQMGQYWNEVYADVAEDGKLTIGVESPKVEAGHVVLFDNFRLEYLGDQISTAISTAATPHTGAIYNLAGQKVSDAFKGIVIRNGKKMLNK